MENRIGFIVFMAFTVVWLLTTVFIYYGGGDAIPALRISVEKSRKKTYFKQFAKMLFLVTPTWVLAGVLSLADLPAWLTMILTATCFFYLCRLGYKKYIKSR